MRSSHNRRGFTLIEILISMAIFGILTAATFASLATNKNKTVARRTIEQLQVDIQGLQNNAQSGILVAGAVPVAQGMTLDRSVARYTLFADNGNFLLDSGETTGVTDLPSKVVIHRILDSTNVAYDQMAVFYRAPNGDVLLRGKIGAGSWATITKPMSILIKQSQLNVCYSVTVQPVIGTVSQRSSIACP